MHFRWHLIEQISVSGIRSHVTSQMNHQAVLFDGEGAMSSTGSLGFHSLLEVFKVRTQQLAEVGR